MHKVLIVWITTLFTASTILSQEYARGLNKTDFDTSKLIYREIPVTRSGLPSSYSLQNYAPPIGDQGKLGSCTSWSSAYCALTIVERIETNSNVGPFDPINLHNRLKALNSEGPCTNGNYAEQAASLLKTNGCPELSYQSCGYVPASYKYQSKLSAYENLSIAVYDFKYVLSQEKSPIVISAHYYTNGWGNVANLSNGVWNGVCGGVLDGGHAMVIIGYDDYKSGGAFLVQNSWGTSWGENGYFWIRYRDISKIIWSAVQFKPELSEEIDFEDDSEVQMYRFYNDCSLTTYVTLSQNIGQNWITEGWYAISSGGSVDLPIGDRNANQVYWMATAVQNGNYIDWVDNTSGTDMCFDRVNAHKIYDNSSYNCPNVANFHETVPDSRVNMEVTTLTCPNISTRGGETIISTDWNSAEIASLDSLVEVWDGTSGLADPYSLRPIHPDQFGNYDVYFIDKDKVSHFTGTADALVKIKGLKFSNEHNAQGYLEALKAKK
jgi:C1A family cysteine protease